MRLKHLPRDASPLPIRFHVETGLERWTLDAAEQEAFLDVL